jgi:hypothetical protein
MKLLPSLCIFLLCSNSLWAQIIKKVRLDELDTLGRDMAASPSVAIDRKDVRNLIVSSYNNVYVSGDSAHTWTKAVIASGAMGNAGNIQVFSDRKGNFAGLHLADRNSGNMSGYAIVSQQSKDGGLTWNENGFIPAQEPSMDLKQYRECMQHYRCFMLSQSGALYLTWTKFDAAGKSDPALKSNIFFSQSRDGDKWSKPVQINQQSGNCLNGDQTTAGANPIVSIDGKIGVIWAWNEKIYLDRSYNKGDTWLTNDLEVAPQPGGWSVSVPGLPHCKGTPVAVIDNGFDHFHGSLYVAWTDQRNGAEDTDIWFVRSSNFGDYWSQPIRIAGAIPEKHQFQPAMVVDQATGCIYIAYFDRSKYEDLHTDLLLAYSVDGGASFKHTTVAENFLLPSERVPYDDYLQLDAYRAVITPVWIQSENGKASVWTSLIRHQELAGKK